MLPPNKEDGKLIQDPKLQLHQQEKEIWKVFQPGHLMQSLGMQVKTEGTFGVLERPKTKIGLNLQAISMASQPRSPTYILIRKKTLTEISQVLVVEQANIYG